VTRVNNVCRLYAINDSTCRRMNGYRHSDGYCYFSPSNCSANYTYANCQCYMRYSTSYNKATCINFNGGYVDGICYYNSASCRHWYNWQCYNTKDRYYSSSNCSLVGGVFDGYYCFYNIFNWANWTMIVAEVRTMAHISCCCWFTFIRNYVKYFVCMWRLFSLAFK